MKIQLPADSSAPPLSAWPLVHPRANRAPNPISAPPVIAVIRRPVRRDARTTLDRAAETPGGKRRRESAQDDAQKFDNQPIAEWRRASLGAGGDHTGKRTRRAEPTPGDDVRAQKHEADTGTCQVRVRVRLRRHGYFTSGPRSFDVQSWNEPAYNRTGCPTTRAANSTHRAYWPTWQ